MSNVFSFYYIFVDFPLFFYFFIIIIIIIIYLFIFLIWKKLNGVHFNFQTEMLRQIIYYSLIKLGRA